MRRRTICLMLLITVGVTCALAISDSATGQVKKGKTRPMTTEQLMEGLVRPNCAKLGKAFKADAVDEKAWKGLATKAALLNEASYILMADSRCPDAEWNGAAMKLREASAQLLKEVDAKNVEGAKSTFKQLTKSCAACHKAHRKDEH
ncbi:MAG: cytochrome c [Pirellulales bacterium]